jgi:hypothetical protein
VDQPRILIVDDMEQEGLDVARALWAVGLPAMFFHFSAARLAAHTNRTAGVRLVFMDINLVGGAFGDGGPAFAAVEQSLRTLLAENNGPYVLATWSAHDDAAERLFAQLKERLPAALVPVKFVRIEKEHFIGEANAAALQARVQALLEDVGNAKVLIEWERTLRRAAGDTVNELLSLARAANADNPDAELGKVLRALAHAESSKHLTDRNAFRAAGTVLNQVLSDVVERASELNDAACSTLVFNAAPAEDLAWKHRLNRFLLVERTPSAARHAPGDVFLYPSLQVQEEGVGHAVNRDQFIAEHFVQENKRDQLLEGGAGARKVDRWKLILIETSPPCDYSEDKVVWHRYAVGVEIPLADRKFLESNLRRVPPFCMGDGTTPRQIAVDARLILTLPPDKIARLGDRLYRIRERVATDLNGWIAAQHARQGYVFVSLG